MLSYFKNLFSSKPKIKSLDGLEGIAYADTVFNNLVAEHKVPGLSVTIFQNKETLLQKGYGHANIEKRKHIEPKSTLFRIASISKCVTGLAFGKMVEEGVMDWNDSFYKHVPYYPKKKHDFTLEQLASHTAGIRGYRGKEFALNKHYSIKDSLTVFQNDPLVFEPGKGYLYNSYDFVLLSLAMQEASGRLFEDYVREKVLIPLGMKHTMTPEEFTLSFRTKREISISEFYSRRTSGFKKAIEVDNFYKLAGGGYLSTSNDIAKMGLAILEQQLLKKETYEKIFAAKKVNGKSTYYGLGFQTGQDTYGRSFIGHVGNSVGAYSNFFVYPKDRLAISILTNCTDPKVQSILDGAIRRLQELNS